MDDMIILDVPFCEKDEAKMLGARWNPEIKKWFIPKKSESKLFSKWIPSDNRKHAEQKMEPDQ